MTGALDDPRELEERLYCYRLKLSHFSYAEIARMATAEFDRPFSAKMVKARIEREYAERVELNEHLQARVLHQELERLDGLERQANDIIAGAAVVVDGVPVRHLPKDRIAAINAALRIKDMRAKLLGLYAPEKVDATLTVTTPDDPAVLALIEEAEAVLKKEGSTP